MKFIHPNSRRLSPVTPRRSINFYEKYRRSRACQLCRKPRTENCFCTWPQNINVIDDTILSASDAERPPGSRDSQLFIGFHSRPAAASYSESSPPTPSSSLGASRIASEKRRSRVKLQEHKARQEQYNFRLRSSPGAPFRRKRHRR
ncbi:hypothetical protein PUN28_003100 [Cardiocondyla obscurior]|uniref:Uncharacterized protein n=1 Tax=Cardiocondyla obscurior TaxID=286306 RepID=A0AAW2GKG2_9HYME